MEVDPASGSRLYADDARSDMGAHECVAAGEWAPLTLRRMSYAKRHCSGGRLPRLRAIRPYRKTPEAFGTARATSYGSGPQPRRLLTSGPTAGRRARPIASRARGRLLPTC